MPAERVKRWSIGSEGVLVGARKGTWIGKRGKGEEVGTTGLFVGAGGKGEQKLGGKNRASQRGKGRWQW